MQQALEQFSYANNRICRVNLKRLFLVVASNYKWLLLKKVILVGKV